MEREPAIRSLSIQNLLSFGEKKTTIVLENLNVLIGANGSGKSNLIEVIGLLQSTPGDLGAALSAGGSIDEWLWKGSGNSQKAYIVAELGRQSAASRLMYLLGFAKVGYRFEIVTEMIDTSESDHYFYSFSKGQAFIISAGTKRELRSEEINPRLSVLAQRKDPDNYPEVTHVGDLFNRFRLYKGWEFGSHAKLREPCDAGLQADYLEEDGSNLGVVLGRLLARPPVKDQLIESLQTFYENVKDLRTNVEGGKIQTRLEEKVLTPASL